MANSKPPCLPNFKTLSDQVFVHDSDRRETTHSLPSDHPDVIIIYGWGDALPSHVAKYTNGFSDLYPCAKQIVVLSPIFKALRQSLAQRTRSMMLVIEEAFRQQTEQSILVHVMSNTGAINYASTLNAYRERFGQALPHRLTILDSSPGSHILTWENLCRWSYAMALGTASSFPWPFALTRCLWGIYLCSDRLFDNMLAREPAQGHSRRILVEATFETPNAQRIYLYGRKDAIISSEDIEEHLASSKEAGYTVEGVTFPDTGHVEHMRRHPKQYWEAIETAWLRTGSPPRDR